MTEQFERFKEMLAKGKTTFFLFGDTAVNSLESEGRTPEYIVNNLEGDYRVFAYREGYNDPEDLLHEYNGWNNFTLITLKQYYEFLTFEKNEKL